ncbi:MAG: hypothetical protein U0237_19875 [Thermoleophilia bacterium]
MMPYAWAERRRIVRNKITNTIQVYPPLEEVFPDKKPGGASADSPEPPIFQAHTDDYLLSLGAPAEWLPYLRKITDHEALFEGLAKFPDDVAERLFDVANGKDGSTSGAGRGDTELRPCDPLDRWKCRTGSGRPRAPAEGPWRHGSRSASARRGIVSADFDRRR